MTTVKTEIGARDKAYQTIFSPTGEIIETDVQRAIEAVMAYAVAIAAGLPDSSVDNTVPRFSGTGGDIEGTAVTIDDNNFIGTLPGIGIGGATADVTNRISANTPAVLFNRETDDIQVKLNKETAADTASFVFQTGFSGRAEIGLVGDDDFQFKVSPDGSTFFSGLVIDKDDGSISVPIGLNSVLKPSANDGAALGTTALGWSDLHLASGALINYANGNAVITHSSGILTISTGDLRITTAGTDAASAVTVGGTQTLTNKTLTTPVINGAVTTTGLTLPAFTLGGTVTSNGQSFSGTIANLGTVTTADINGGTLDGAVIGGASAAAITGTVITGNRFVPNSSTVPTDGFYLPAANTLGWAINSAAEMQLTSTALSPAADGGSSLGTTALGWQNLFGNTGFVVNIENGNWVATHTSGILTVGTGDLRVTTAGTNTASVVTVGGTQTLTAKTLTTPTISGATLTGVLDAGGATSFEVPNSASPTVDADGEIAIDTSVADFSHGILKYFGGEEMAVIAVPIAELTSPTNGDVITYNSTADEFQLSPSAGGSGYTLGTEQATTSGTTIDFTGIGSNATRVTIIFNEVSLSGTDHYLIQIGTSGGVENSGYVSTAGTDGGTTGQTAGFAMFSNNAGRPMSGSMTLHRVNASNLWISSHAAKSGGANVLSGGGSKTLAGTLDRVRLATTGANSFDAGTANILWE